MPINSFLYPGAKFIPPYTVDNSCRFNDDDTAYMHKTPSSSGSQRTFTFSTWWKQGDLASSSVIFSSGEADGDPNFAIYYNSSQQLNVLYYEGSSLLQLITNAKYRDPGGWYHICVAIDTTQSTNTDRAKIYINGSQVTSLGTATYCNQNVDISINTSSYRMAIGAGVDNGDVADGYAAETVFIDGSALAPTSFGEFDEDSPTIFKPKDVSGLTFGTNGFYLDYKDSSNLGNDANGGTDLTEVNLAATDQSLDSPTNNFCNWNTLIRNMSTYAYSEGNLQVNTSSSHEAAYGSAFSNFGMTAGKYYAEFKITANADDVFIGVSSNLEDDILGSSGSAYTFSYKGNGWAYYGSDGKVQHTDSDTWLTYGASLSNNDIVGVALDLDNLELYFSVNGTWQNSGDPTSGASKTGGVVNAGAKALNGSGSTGTWYFCASDNSQTTVCTVQANFGSPINTISSGNADDNGYGNFEYDVPTGYLALCTKNLGSDGG